MKKLLVLGLAIIIIASCDLAYAVDLTGLTYTVYANLNSASAIYYIGDKILYPVAVPLDTKINVEDGNTITIFATGTWGNSSDRTFGSGGDPYENVKGEYLGAGLPVASLIGEVGDGPWFNIGTGITGTVSGSGELLLAFNDTDYGNNWGSVTVTIGVNGEDMPEIESQLVKCQDEYGNMEADLAGLLAFANLPPGQRRKSGFEPMNSTVRAIRDILIPGRKRE